LQRQGNFSGLNDFDYQDLGNLTEGRIKDIQQIRTINKIPIPNEIMDNFKSCSYKSKIIYVIHHYFFFKYRYKMSLPDGTVF
jgi:hypothetical protein